MGDDLSPMQELGAKGGEARAKSLTSEERKEIARNAARARWEGSDVLRAEHEGTFKIGDREISAAVLPNGKRLLTQGTFLMTLGRARTPKAGTGVMTTVDGLPFFLQAEVLNQFIDDNLRASTTPVFYRDKSGKRSVGYDANLLPEVAKVYVKYRNSLAENGKRVPKQYKHIVEACDVILHALANVAIAALVDEATGYQDFRAHDALAKILEKFIAKELRPYLSAFPLDWFRELCRLKGIAFSENMRLPPYVGKLVNDLVYRRLAPGVLAELRKKNPVYKGRRASKHYKWLTENVGHPKLLQLLGSELTLMRMSETWGQFKKLVDKYHPIYGDYPLLDWAERESAKPEKG